MITQGRKSKSSHQSLTLERLRKANSSSQGSRQRAPMGEWLGFQAERGLPNSLVTQIESQFSTGQLLDEGKRAHMESAFNRPFDDVRLHQDTLAASLARSLGAHAFSVRNHVFFGANEHSGNEKLLAHELAHVVQNRNSPSRNVSDVTEPGHASEAEAERASRQVGAGGTTSVSATSGGGVSRSLLDWVEETASDVGSSVVDAGSGAMDWVADSAEDYGPAALDIISDVYSIAKEMPVTGLPLELAHGIYDVVANDADVTDVTLDVLNPFPTMEEARDNAASVKGIEDWFTNGVDWVQDTAAGHVQNFADTADGIPVLEDIADAGASGFDMYSQLQAGVLQGAGSLVSGVAQMAVNPVDTATGLFAMAEQAPIIPGIANPLRVAHGLYDVALNDADFGGTMNQVLNPAEVMQEQGNFWWNVGDKFLDPYRASIGDDGDYGQAAGRALFDIAGLVMGGGGATSAAGAVDDVARIANIADDAARIGTVADDVARIGGVADDVGRVGGAVDDVAGLVDNLLGTSDEAAGLIDDVGGVSDEVASVVDDTRRGLDIETHGTPNGELSKFSDADIDAFSNQIEANVTGDTFFNLPGHNPRTGGGLELIRDNPQSVLDPNVKPFYGIDTRINTNPNQITYHTNHYFTDIAGGSIDDMASTTAVQTPPHTSIDSAALGGNVEVRYHSANPNPNLANTYSGNNPTAQINTPTDSFGWMGDRPANVADVAGSPAARGLYLLPDGSWKRIADMTSAERAAAHWPVGGRN